MSRFIILMSSLLLFSLPVVMRAQEDAESCTGLLREALRAHHAPPDSGSAVRRAMRITTVRRIGARLDTTTNEAEAVNWNGGEMIRSEGTEIWSDEQTIVIADEKEKRLRVVDLSDKRKILAAQKRFQGVFPDSLVGYGRGFQCREIGTKSEARTQISFRIDTTMQTFFNAAAMTVEVDAHREIVRMSITHPASSPVRSTEYVVRTIDREWKGNGVGDSVLRHFVDESGKLRPEYAAYRVAR